MFMAGAEIDKIPPQSTTGAQIQDAGLRLGDSSKVNPTRLRAGISRHTLVLDNSDLKGLD
jgi:hypothetical protein